MIQYWKIDASTLEASEVPDVTVEAAFLCYHKTVLLQNWFNFIIICAGGSFASWASYEAWNVPKANDVEAY